MIELFEPRIVETQTKVRTVNGRASEDSDAPEVEVVPAPPVRKGAAVPKLSRQDVAEIRALFARWKRKRDEWQRFNKTQGLDAIAAQFGICSRYVNRIVCNDVWTEAGRKKANLRASPLRGVVKWAQMEIDSEPVFYPCAVDERRMFCKKFYKAAWAWRDRNNSDRKFRVRAVSGGVAIRRIA